nr:hypothetical protein [Paucibacter sp. M5-1]MCZ7880915.1 hypothetical protein [Paucibacter sp. M5-1]
MGRRLAVVAPASGLPPGLLLQWIAAQQGLSAAWHLEDDEHTEAQLPLSVLSRRAGPGGHRSLIPLSDPAIQGTQA